MGPEHEVEGPRFRELALDAAVRADVRLQVVGAEAVLAVTAVDHRVGEGGDVAAGLPDLRVHDDRSIDTDDVVTLLDHGGPPEVLDVALHLDTKRSVVPEAPDAAVDLAAGEHEAASLAQGDQGLELQLGVGVRHWVAPGLGSRLAGASYVVASEVLRIAGALLRSVLREGSVGDTPQAAAQGLRPRYPCLSSLRLEGVPPGWLHDWEDTQAGAGPCPWYLWTLLASFGRGRWLASW